MATKLNSNALVNDSVSEEKLTSGVKQKLNKTSIPEAPIDDKQYARKNGEWDEVVANMPKLIFDKDLSVDDKHYIIKNKCRETVVTPIEHTRLDTYTESGTYELPENVSKVQLFLVNGGNGGTNGTSSVNLGYGGQGGNTKEITIEEDANSIQVTIGAAGSANAGKGGTTSVIYNENTYSCDAQGNNSQSGIGADGVAAPSWAERTELFGASGGGGITRSSTSTPVYAGGTTGGGSGAANGSSSSYRAYSTPGSFYGAGGGGGAYRTSYNREASAGYQGIVIAKITWIEHITEYLPINSTECKGVVYVTKEQWQTLLEGGEITDGTITHSYNKDYLYAVNEPLGVEEAPIDGTPYIRQDAGWIGYEYPPLDEPVIIEVTTAGENIIQVPPLCHYCEAFLVNGGNGGGNAHVAPYDNDGGLGGKSAIQHIGVAPLNEMKVIIGAAGSAGGGAGGTTIIQYERKEYSPQVQPSGTGPVLNGVLNPLNSEDTNLYGAAGGYGGFSSGGITGGGNGGRASSSTTRTDATPGSFYGAGGGGGAYQSTLQVIAYPAKGYRGYAYLKFT